MAAKQSTSVSLTSEQRRAIEDARLKRARGNEMPSVASIVREALDRGLPLVVDDGRKAG